MLSIKVFSDFACPFCYIALGFFQKFQEENIDFSLEWIPYEMDPSVPKEGKDIREKFPQAYYEKILQYQNQIGKEYGIKFNTQTKQFNTHRALLAGEYAKSVNKYDEFSNEMFKAYFYDLKNIGDKEVINKIGEKLGLNIEEMNRAIDSNRFGENMVKAKKLMEEFQVDGVPTFIINGKHKIVGIRPYDQMKNSFLSFIEE